MHVLLLILPIRKCNKILENCYMRLVYYIWIGDKIVRGGIDMNRRTLFRLILLFFLSTLLINCNLFVSLFENFKGDKSKSDTGPVPTAEPGSVTFNYSNSVQTFIVPQGITIITVECWGAQGYSVCENKGGYGGYATADVNVTPGETVYVYVGGVGQPAKTGYGECAFNGGGKGYDWNETIEAGGGGGASDIRIGGESLYDRIVVAGGGGGATCNSGCNGGGGGGYVGLDAPDLGDGYATGGTQDCGGSGGGNGSFGYGGNAGEDDGWIGGGGGGWYGGGAGFCHGPGAGGSSYIDGQSPYTTSNGWTNSDVNIGDGQVIITWGNSMMLE
jgi:hypothetical protein